MSYLCTLNTFFKGVVLFTVYSSGSYLGFKFKQHIWLYYSKFNPNFEIYQKIETQRGREKGKRKIDRERGRDRERERERGREGEREREREKERERERKRERERRERES